MPKRPLVPFVAPHCPVRSHRAPEDERAKAAPVPTGAEAFFAAGVSSEDLKRFCHREETKRIRSDRLSSFVIALKECLLEPWQIPAEERIVEVHPEMNQEVG